MSNRAIKMQLLVGLIFFAINSHADEIILNVNTKKPIAVTSEKFLSLTIDPITLLRGDSLTTNFERSSRIVKALAPAYLRFAGPQSNFYTLSTYSQHDQPDLDNPFTEEHWIALQRWGERTGLDVISCITPQYADTGAIGEPMNSKKIFDLLSFSDRLEYNTSWQIGYECQTRCDLPGSDLGKYVTQLRNKLDSFPRYSNSIIVGPDIVTYRSRQQQLYLQDYLTAAYAGLSAITWHPNFAGVTVNEIGVTIHQENLAADKEDLHKVISHATGKKPLWLAESKTEECKDQFLGALLWMRRLGNAAKIGAQVLMRNPANPSEPTPDYWVSLLHKTLVGREVLEVKTQAGNNSHVHFYGQCTKPSEMYEKGALTVFAVNLTPAKVTASLKGTKVKSLHEYILQPGFDTYNRMFAKTVLLNNKPLRLTKDGDVPNLIPLIKTGTKGADFELPPGGIGFWVIPDAKIKSCTDHEDQTTDKALRKASKQVEEHGRIRSVQYLDDASANGKTNEATDERRRQRKKLQKHEEDEYEEKKSKKNDLQKYLEVLAKVLRKKFGAQEDNKPLILKGSYTLFDSNHGRTENVESDKNVRFKKIKAILEEYKNKVSTMDKNTDAKTTAQALDLISKIENGMETLERETDNITGIESPEKSLVTSEKLENIYAQMKNHLEQLYRILPEEQSHGEILNDENVSYNALKFKAFPTKDASKRIKRDIDGKIVEEYLNFRRDNSFKKRVRNEDVKDRRNDRQNRRKETGRREGVTPYYDYIRSDSNENSFHGFWKQEPPKSFPHGDIYLATGDSSEKNNKDYEYIEDEEIPQDEQRNAKVKTLLVDYAEPDDTWVGDGSDHLGYVPNEFYEIVNIPNVHTKEDLKDYGELWEAESLQTLSENENVPKEDVREIKIISERRPIEKDENQTKQKTAERLMKYYQDIQDSVDDDVLREESDNDSRHLESKEINTKLLNRNIPIYVSKKDSRSDREISVVKNGRNRQEAQRKVKPILSNGDDELIDFNSMHFTRQLPPSRESQVHDRQYSRRPKRRIGKLDDIFNQEMIAQDDNNLKDCECRVTRHNRLKRNVANIEANEETINEPKEKLQTGDSLSSEKSSSEIEVSTQNTLQEESAEFFRGNIEQSKEQTSSVNLTYHYEDNSKNRKTLEPSVAENSFRNKTETIAESREIQKTTTARTNEETSAKAALKKRQSSVEVLTTDASAETNVNVASSTEQDNFKQEPSADQKPQQQTSKPTKRFTDTKAFPPTFRTTASKRINPKSTDSSTKWKTKVSQRAEELARIIESRLAARAEALEALRRENERRERRLTNRSAKNPSSDNTRLQDSQRKRSELLDKLKEKLAARREKMLQTYHDELQRVLEKSSDEGKRNIKRREIWEKFTESDNYKDMVDGEKLAYVLTYKPTDYQLVNTERKVQNDNTDKKYVSVTEITKPLHQVREKLVNLKSSTQISYDPTIMSYTDYGVLGSVKYPSIDEITKSKDELRNGERGSGKVYYSIVENLNEPRIFEYQPKLNQENIAVPIEQQSDKVRTHILYRGKEYTHNKLDKSVKPNEDEQYRNAHYLIRPEQDTQIPLQEQQLYRITPRLLEQSRKESGHSKSGSTSKNQELKQYQVVYRLNKAEQKPRVPEKEQNVKIPSHAPKASGKDRTNDRFKNLFTPEERIEIIRLLTNVENNSHMPISQQKNVEVLSRTVNGKDHTPSVLESFFTPEELQKYQIIQSPITPIVRQQNIQIKTAAQNMDESQGIYSLSENIAPTEDVEIYEESDSSSEEDSEESSQDNSSTGRRVYVIDASAYRGGDPILQLHEDDIENTSGSEEKSEPENLYRVLWDVRLNKPYEILEQSSAKQKSNIQDFPIITALPNGESYKQFVQLITDEKGQGEQQNNAPILYILETTKPDNETKEAKRKCSEKPSCTIDRRDVQHTNKTDETGVSVEEISGNRVGEQSNNDNAQDHHSNDDKKMITDNGEFDQTKNISALHTTDDYAEKKKRTTVDESISLEEGIVDDVEQETKRTSSVEQHDNAEILTTRKKRAVQNWGKEHSSEWLHPIILAPKVNYLERNIKPVNSKSTGANENLTGNVHRKEKIFQLVQPDEYYKALPVEVGNIEDRARINRQNVGQRVQDKRASSVYPNFLSRNSKYHLQHNRNQLENRDTTSQKIIGVIIPPESQDKSVTTDVKIMDQSAESIEYDSYSDSCKESSGDSINSRSSNSEFPRRRAVLINISGEHDNEEGFETILEDTERNRYRGKKLTANEFPHLYDILKANNGNKEELMMLLPMENSKLMRHRRHVAVENNEPGKSQILSEKHSMSINEDTEDVTADQFVEEENTQNEENDNENNLETIRELRKEDQLIPKYIAEKNRLLKEFEEIRRNKKYTLSSQEAEEIIENINQNIDNIKYEVPLKNTDFSFVDINENSIDFNNFENNQHGYLQNGYENIEGLSTYLENGIPKVENAIEMGLEKVKNFTGSVEHFIEDFDDKFNETLSPNERIKLHENESPSTPAQSVFNSAIISIKKIFKFLSGITRLLHT